MMMLLMDIKWQMDYLEGYSDDLNDIASPIATINSESRAALKRIGVKSPYLIPLEITAFGLTKACICKIYSNY